MSEQLLPLFPLQAVMFPGARLPLHIFEDRYRDLVNECLREEKEFGMTLAVGGDVASVGCTAAVSSVLKRYPDGRMDIVVEGRRRFRVHGHDVGPVGYLVGRVEYLPSDPQEVDRRLADETIRLYNDLVTLVYKERVDRVQEGSSDSQLSFFLAQKAGLDLPQRQQLLETESENERLKILHQYLTVVLPRLTRASEVERVIRSDGYLQSEDPSEEE